MHSKSSEVRAYLGLILTFIIWGSLYVVSNILLKSLPTFFIAFMRYAIAFITMSVMFRVHVSKMKGAKTSKKLHLDRMGRRYVFILGFCGYVISVGLQLLGTKYAGSTMASLINALNPVAISLCAVPALKEKLTGNKIIGIILAVFGIYLIVGTGGSINVPGIVLSLLSVLTWALVSVFTREGLSTYDTYAVTRAAAGLAAACNFVLFLIEHFAEHTVIRVLRTFSGTRGSRRFLPQTARRSIPCSRSPRPSWVSFSSTKSSGFHLLQGPRASSQAC